MIVRETPKFTGVIIHNDPQGRFTVRYPSSWYPFDLNDGTFREIEADGSVAATEAAAGTKVAEATENAAALEQRDGIGVAPNPSDPHTSLTMWVAHLDEHVVAEDFDELKAGMDDGMAALPECHIESAQDQVISNLVKFERIYTFREGDAIRKRKQWLLYVDEWLMCLTWQGSTEEEYDYWFAMANQTFLTFQIPEALWFATDRDFAALRGTWVPDKAQGEASAGDERDVKAQDGDSRGGA